MLQIRPIERQVNAGLSGFLSGAGSAARGFAEAEDLKRRRELEQQQVEANQRRLALAEQAQENQMAQFLERQSFQRQKQEREVAGQEAAGRAMGAFGDAMGAGGQASAEGGQASAEGGQASAEGDQGGATGIPEFDAAVGEIGKAVQSGGMTPAQGTQALKMLGARQEATIQKMRGDDLAKQLHDEVALGEWDPAKALGMEPIDVDGDGQPDPISDTPALLLQALQDGVDPSFVQTMHEQVRQAMSGHRAKLERRTGIAAESETAMLSKGSQITPEGHMAARAVLDKWNRGIYPATEQGEREFKSDFEQAQLGNVPIVGKGGVKYYVPQAQAAEAELGLKKQQNPERDLREWASKLVGNMLGTFKPDPYGDAKSNEEAYRIHRARWKEAEDELLNPPKSMNIPAPTERTMPTRAAVLTSGKPAGQASSQAEAVSGDVGGGGPAEAPSTEPTSPTPGAEAPGTQQTEPSAPASKPQEPSAPRARFDELLEGRDLASLSVAEKAEIARKIKEEFGDAANNPGPEPQPAKAEPKPVFKYKGDK